MRYSGRELGIGIGLLSKLGGLQYLSLCNGPHTSVWPTPVVSCAGSELQPAANKGKEATRTKTLWRIGFICANLVFLKAASLERLQWVDFCLWAIKPPVGPSSTKNIKRFYVPGDRQDSRISQP